MAVLLVCTANICRSPMAEGLLREELRLRGLKREVLLDSAGTNATQPGHPADARALRVCARAGIDLRRSRARQVTQEDFCRFDHILAMDERNFAWLQQHCPEGTEQRLSLLGSWSPGGVVGSIPDPYFSSLTVFEEVLDLLRLSMEGLVPSIIEKLHGDP